MIANLLLRNRVHVLQVSFRKGIGMAGRYRFGSSQRKKNPQSISEQKAARQQQIEYRKKMMEEHQLRTMRDKIQNTKGNFNPFIAYLRLYRSFFTKLALLLGLTFFTGMCFQMIGVDRDPFSGKKKLFLISNAFEKSMDGYLSKMVVDQLCASKSSQKISSALKAKGQQLQVWLREKTNRTYRIVIISCQQHVVTVLPQTIIISKNMLLSRAHLGGDLEHLVLLMESLFIKKFHISDLAISNVFTFRLAQLIPSPVSDIKLASIYSRKYTDQEVQQTILEMSLKYKVSVEELKGCLEATLEKISQFPTQTSTFSINKRFQGVNLRQD